jgi:hypothetical protein
MGATSHADPQPRLKTSVSDAAGAQPPPPDYDLSLPGPANRLLALQKSHGNYFVQRAINSYNAKHPLPDKAPAPPAKPPAAPPIPAVTAVPAAKTLSPAAPRKATAPAPAKPIPSVSSAGKKAASGKSALGSGAGAVAAALHPISPGSKKSSSASSAPSAIAGNKAAGPTLGQWKAKAGAAANKQLVAPPPKSAPAAAASIDADAKKKAAAPQPDFKGEAAKKIPPPPKPDVPAAPADTLAKSVHDLIATVSDKRLTDQTLPELAKSPGHAGIAHPEGEFPVVGDPPPIKQDQPPAPDANPTAPAATPELTAEQAEAKKKEAEAALKKKVLDQMSAPVPGAPVTVHDSGPKPSPPIPETAKADIGDAVVVVLSQSEAESKEIVTLAEKTAYPKGALAEQAPEIARDAMAPEKTRLDGELHAIGAAAGFEAAELDAKAAKKAEEAKNKGAEAAVDLQAKSTSAGAETKKKAEDDRKAIAAAKARNDDEIELKSEAAGTPPDPKIVNEREQRLLDSLDEQSSTSRVAYRKALEAREQSLSKATGDQIEAYRRTAQTEADEIKALYPDDIEKAKTEAWPSTAWADTQAKTLRERLAVLKRDAGKESKGFQDDVTAKQIAASLKIHDWADTRLSKTRSWWEKIMQLFAHWEHAARADTAAWERARDQQTLDNMVGDLATINNIKDLAGKQNVEEMKAAIDGLDEEHQILLLKFFKAGGDSIMTVAGALLGRIEQRRVPELSEDFRKKSLDIGNWEKLNKLAQSKDANFDAWHLAGEVRSAVKGWGTNEEKLFAAIKHRSPLQIKAVKLAYAERYREMDPESPDYGKSRDMAEDIDDDLSGDEAKRAKSALEGDVAGEDVFALHDALTGTWGADKAVVMETLRGKSPVERDELLARYKDEYGMDLREHLKFTMPDENDRDRANALLTGETDKADAIGLRQALHSHVFGGAEITEVDAVYAQIRKEVEADAAARNMTTAEVEAEYKRRAGAVEQQWNGKYGEGKPGAMKEAFKDRLSGGEQDLAVALAEDNHIVEDAARIRAESESVLYTSDKKVLSVLSKQRERAETEVRRDMMVRFREQAAKEKWTPEEAKKKFDEMNAQAEKDIEVKAQGNLDNLEKHYDKAYSRGFGPGELTAVIEFQLSGNEQEEARLLRKQAGKMTGAQEVYWATTGLGTNDELLRHALKGKSKAELNKMREEYKKVSHGGDMDKDVFGDVSGRDEFDFGQMLEGKPETPDEELKRIQEKREYETGSGSGLGSLFAAEETDSLTRTSQKADQAFSTYKDAVKTKGENSPEAKAALERFREWSGYTDEAITEHREAVDTVTDHIAMGAAIVVGAIVAIATAGTATPAVIAAVSALAATSASITVKLAMKGHAYGIEEYGADVLMGGVDVAVAALTAGVGNALLRTNLLSRLAEDQVITRVAKYGIAHAGAGLIAGLPTGIIGQLISSETWNSDAPLKTFLLGLLKSEGMAAGMAAGFGGIEGLKGGHGPAAPHEEVTTGTKPSGEAPVREQKPPAPEIQSDAKQIAKATPPTELEGKLNSIAKPDEQPHTPGTPEAKAAHTAAVAKNELKMQGGGDKAGPPVQKGGKALPPEPRKGTTYVEPGSREYHAMLHEGWTDQMLRQGLGPVEAPKAPGGPELHPGEFRRGIKTPEEAYSAYNEARARAPGREVGIFRNLDTGEYVVRVGGAGSVDFPYGDVPHEAVLHNHPNTENILTYRLPSGADVGEAYLASARLRRPVTQFVEHDIPGTSQRARTAITVDAETGKIRVEYMGPEGVKVKEFANGKEYHAYYNERTVAPTGQTLQDIIDETNQWLSERRGEPVEMGYDNGKPVLKMAGGTAPPAPPVPQFEFAPGMKPERRTAGTGGISRITKLRDAFGAIVTKIDGILQPGMNRSTAPNYNKRWPRAQMVAELAPEFERQGLSPADARTKATAFANNYEAAHLWGPGFGDEAAAGMMWAPISVNQEVQNQFSEQFSRDLRRAAAAQGGSVRVTATGVSFSPETLRANHLPANMLFLEHVQYKITLELPNQPARSITVTVEATLPGSGARSGLRFDPPEAATRFMELFGLK